MAKEQEHRPHDPSYRRIFTHVGIVRQLIERFIDPALTERLDLDHIEATPTDFTAEGLARREGDLLWKIPIIGQDLPLYVFVWLELQSWPDPKMPVRLLSYILLFYEQLLTQKPDYIEHGLPLVLPVVLYNGLKPWNVPLRLEELYAPDPVDARVSYRIQGGYYLIRVHGYSKAQLEQINTSLATLFLVEQATPKQINALLDLLIEQVHAESLLDAQRHITAWLTAALKAKKVHFPNPSIDSLLEFKTMLEENIERWFQQKREEGLAAGLAEGLERGLEEGREAGREEGRKEGREEGREEGAVMATRAHLLKQLNLKFGPREGREAELHARQLAELELAIERVLFATHEDALWD